MAAVALDIPTLAQGLRRFPEDLEESKVELVARELLQTVTTSEKVIFRHPDFQRSIVILRQAGTAHFFVRENKKRLGDEPLGPGSFKKLSNSKHLLYPGSEVAIATFPVDRKSAIEEEIFRRIHNDDITAEIYFICDYTSHKGKEKEMIIMEKGTMDFVTFLNEGLSRGRDFKSASDMLKRLMRLHARGIIHRDVKPENFLIIPDSKDPFGFKIVIIDFNLSCYDEASRRRDACNMFVPPELAIPVIEILIIDEDAAEEERELTGVENREIAACRSRFYENCSYAQDVWSLAHIFMFLFSKHLSRDFIKSYDQTFNTDNETKRLIITSRLQEGWLRRPSNALEALISDMFKLNKEDRPTAAKAYERLIAIEEEMRRTPISVLETP